MNVVKGDESLTAKEERLLVLAPTPRDTQICCETLGEIGIDCTPCANLRELCEQLKNGAGAALLTEEAFLAEEAPLLCWLEGQPTWSDLPLLFLTRGSVDSKATLRALNLLGNVMLLERPLRKGVLVSAARAALRQRRRQYQTRSHLAMLGRARQAAEEASRAKSEFLANMSHEIRTPMTVFMGATEHLLTLDSDPERCHILEMADQAARRLRALIDDILDLSRIEAREIEIEEREFELRSCVDGAVGMFILSAREKNLRIDTEVAPEIPNRVLGDPHKLGQVLINLVGNALKFTSEGEIRVTVRPHGGTMKFTVADTGIGIPEEKHHLLFKSFSQTDGSFHRQYGGTGLGLAISKGLVELMGGQISVRSRKGEGSVFTFTLPLKVAPGKRLQAPPIDLPSEENLKVRTSARILVAEDDPTIQAIVKTILDHHGWTPETAGNGREALKKWERQKIDLILMDLQMPEMDGFEATRAIRKMESEEGRKRTCIIALTAHARPEIKVDCLKAGMNDVLTKPIQMKNLISAIDSCLSKR